MDNADEKGHAQLQRGRFEEAGGCEPALLGMAVALQKLARYEEAGRAYRELLQINPDSAEPLANLIALSVARQDAAAVAEYCTRLVEVDPDSFEGWANLRHAQQRTRPPGEAARSIA